MKLQQLMQIKAADKDGNMHQDLVNYLGQLVQILQTNLSDQGYKVPQQPTATITALNTPQSTGALLYDNETHELKININGTFKTVQVA